MLYHFTSRAHWERIVEDGEIKALSPPDLSYEPKVVHLTLSASERSLPKSVVPEAVICIDDTAALRMTSFLEWWSLELPRYLLDGPATGSPGLRARHGCLPPAVGMAWGVLPPGLEHCLTADKGPGPHPVPGATPGVTSGRPA
jgi:hypothetical protein